MLLVSVVKKYKIEGIKYNDGIITKRHTFQKFYNDEELLSFLKEILNYKKYKKLDSLIYIIFL